MRTTALVSAGALSAALTLSACWNPFDPDQGDNIDPFIYHSPVDSAWKALENLEHAYSSMDIDYYLACFRQDFEFHLLEIDWADYTGNGVVDEYWGIDLEEQFHISMFNVVADIELTLSGTQEYPWSGDSTGQSLALPRNFDLKVYTDGGHTTGYMATGQALFVCKQDSTDEWYIWQWWDQSES